MSTALYYPFTTPSTEGFLKSALFLWDSVDFIVPYDAFSRFDLARGWNEAIEVVGRNYVPTDEDKRVLHDELKGFCNGPLADKLRFDVNDDSEKFPFYPQKLLYETWEMLAESRLAQVLGIDSRSPSTSTTSLFGYYMMSLLAVCCARGRMRLVTDESAPYKTLANLLADDLAETPNAERDWHGTLLALSFSGPDFADTPLSELVALRKNEDALMVDIRKLFFAKVDKTATDICRHSSNRNHIRDLIRDYTAEMERDLKELKRALRRSASSLLLSKEFGITVLSATMLTPVEPISGTVVTVGGMTKGLIDYQDRRRKILREHPTSWLLASTKPKVPLL